MAAINGDPTDRPACMPITMMFAARKMGARYRDYATDYRVQVEAQIRVAEEFDLDYVNTMSDPAIEAADCGANVRYFDEQPPAIDETDALLRDKSNLLSLKMPDPTSGRRMSNRLQAMQSLVRQVGGHKVVEGWVEGPCAEGADLRGINTLMLDFTDDPAFVHDLFAFIVEMEVAFAREQVALGADVIGIGDAASSLVGPRVYESFVWSYEKQMVDAIHAMGAKVRLHICGNTSRILTGIGRLGCDLVDLDSMAPITKARAEMGESQVLAGNIDPVRVLANSEPEVIASALAACHCDAGRHYVVAAGCEIPRDTPDSHVHALAAYARGA